MVKPKFTPADMCFSTSNYDMYKFVEQQSEINVYPGSNEMYNALGQNDVQKCYVLTSKREMLLHRVAGFTNIKINFKKIEFKFVYSINNNAFKILGFVIFLITLNVYPRSKLILIYDITPLFHFMRIYDVNCIFTGLLLSH